MSDMSPQKQQCPSCHKTLNLTQEEEQASSYTCQHCDHAFPPMECNQTQSIEKVYPGEKETGLDGFTATAVDTGKKVSKQITKASSSPHVDISKTILTPIHLAAIAAALVIFLVGYLIFALGHHPDGMIFEMTNTKRMILAALISSLGTILFFVGAKHRRFHSLVVTGVLSLGLVGTVYYLKDSYRLERDALNHARSQQNNQSQSTPEPFPFPTSPPSGDTFSDNIQYASYLKLKAAEPDQRTIGLVIDHYSPFFKDDLIHFITTSALDLDSSKKINIEILNTLHPIKNYPACLVIIQHDFDTDQVFETLFTHLSSSVDKTHLDGIQQLTLLQLIVKGAPEQEPTTALSKMTQTHALMHNLSLKAQLQSLYQIEQADRLILAPDILVSLTVLIETRDLAFKGHVVKASKNWISLINAYDKKLPQHSHRVEILHQAILKHAESYISKNRQLPVSFLDYCLAFKLPKSEAILFNIWKQSPLGHETALINSGEIAVKVLLPHLLELNEIQLISACNILKKNGTEASLSQLQAILEKASDEKIRSSVISTIDAIKKRL